MYDKPTKKIDNSNKWGQLNQQLQEAMEKSDFQAMSSAYHEMALHVWENTDKDFIPFLILAHQMEIQHWQRAGVVEKVQIITAKGQCCEYCKSLEGQTYTLQQALEINPIPCSQCTWSKQGARPGWCRCIYIPVVKVEPMSNTSSLTPLMMQLEELKDKQHRLEEEHKKANSAYMGGLIGILLGIFLIIPLMPLGLLFLLAGGLAALTNFTKRATAKKQLTEVQTQITALRQQIASAPAS